MCYMYKLKINIDLNNQCYTGSIALLTTQAFKLLLKRYTLKLRL